MSNAPVERREYFLEGLAGAHRQQLVGMEGRLPNCIIIGASKSGTTTLAASLGKHPDIFVCQPMESKFFTRDYVRGWDWYLDRFEAANGATVRMDVGTRYTCGYGIHTAAPQMIRNYIPASKLIYICRHPMERLVSHWRHRKSRHPEKYGEFNEFIKDAELKKYLVASSLFWHEISAYRKHFPDNQILALAFEDMLTDPTGLLEKVFAFLEVPLGSTALDSVLEGGRFPRLNEAGGLIPKPEWQPDVYEEIRKIIAPDAKQFLESIGKPATFWPNL